ncbi:MAG: cytochrome c maturation protein CcmE [Hyphomonadaceae bacterium]
MKPQHRNRRLGTVALIGVLLVGASVLTLSALNQSVSYFLTPSELVATTEVPTRSIRLGGLVMDGSVVRGEGIETAFRVTDGTAEVTILYSGILPDLFREGQGVIVEGLVLPDGRFDARTVLAKHDENYVPKELQHALKDQGVL